MHHLLYRHRRHPPPNAKRALGDRHPLRSCQRSHRKAQGHLVSCLQEPRENLSHSMRAVVLSPQDGHGRPNVQDEKGVQFQTFSFVCLF
ncbi:hypothetical protein TNCV_512331 [Trichonephila clavipes]|nr:hypothetical protein TNCV_512331 [Trichonephila clavipes]